MSTAAPLFAANAVGTAGEHIENFFARPDAAALIKETHVNWNLQTLSHAPEPVIALLTSIDGIATDGRTLTRSALRLLSKLQLDLEKAFCESPWSQKFQIDRVLAKGSSSLALRAVNIGIGRAVVLKILRPVPIALAESAIRRLGTLDRIPNLIAPVDSFPIDTQSVSGDAVRVYCIVFPYLEAITLDNYLQKRPPLDPFFFEAFIQQIGGVLADLEALGTQHGDLHGSNILISSEEPSIQFAVIDPSPELGLTPTIDRAMSDFDWFKEHLGRSLWILQRHLSSISIQKHLGPRLYSVVTQILSAEIMPFQNMISLLSHDPRYEEWLRKRHKFIESKFEAPKPLGLLRWEEMTDPAQAVELFEPFPELFQRVMLFGNSHIVGARGSGKSTYLAALAYFPGSTKRLVDPAQIFGVLFSCRQGEFKQFSPEFIKFDADSRLMLRHVLILKIIRRVLSILSSAIEHNEVQCSGSFSALYGFISSFMAEGSTIARISAPSGIILANITSGLVRWEESEIKKLFQYKNDPRSAPKRLLAESSLVEFCNLIRILFPGLASTQFYFLFDDAGSPNIPHETQHVLNDLVTSSNSVFCIKVSAERYSYDLRDTGSRTLEETHDITSFDITAALASESGIAPSREAVKQYFARIVGRRLDHWNYPDGNIANYLGDQARFAQSAIPVKELIKRLAANAKNAYYSGWEVVWQLADKTPRNLIELVSEIFAHANIKPLKSGDARSDNLPTEYISPIIQDRAIRAVSDRRLRSLEFIPGSIRIHERQTPLGKHLYLCATSFGTVSHWYLVANRRASTESEQKRRFDERLAIERNDTPDPNHEARHVLQLLVRYGIFDDSVLNVAFDDGQKKPVYIFNRIFCPAFGISFRRDAHLRLSIKKFEMYLLDPSIFARKGTKFLESIASSVPERKLWDDTI